MVNLSKSVNPEGEGGSGTPSRPVHPRLFVKGRRVYGFISVFSEAGSDVSHVFGVGKKTVNIGRGSKNDIRLNARMFSRLHMTLTINEEADGSLVVQVRNESQQKNATRVLPYVLPYGNSVVLESPAVFLLQGRRFKWTLNDGDYEAITNSCPREVVYIYEDCQQPCHDMSNMVEHSKSEASSPQESPSTSSSSKRRRSSASAALELRKLAHHRNYRSSLHQMNLSTSFKPVSEEDANDTDEENGGQSNSLNLIAFSPEPQTATPASSANNTFNSDKSLIDFNSPVAVSTQENNGDVEKLVQSLNESRQANGNGSAFLEESIKPEDEELTEKVDQASSPRKSTPRRQSSRKSSLPANQNQTPQPLTKTPSQVNAMNDSKMSGIQGLFQTPESNGNGIEDMEVDEDSVYSTPSQTPATPTTRRGRPSRASIAPSPAVEAEKANVTLATRTSTRSVSTQNTTIDDPEALNQLFRTPEPNKIDSPATSRLSSRRSTTQSTSAPPSTKVSMTPKRQSSRVSSLQQIVEAPEPQEMTPTKISKMEKTMNMSGMSGLFQTPEAKASPKGMTPASVASSKLNYSQVSTASVRSGRKSRASISSSLNVETDTMDLSMISDNTLPLDETFDDSEALGQLFQTPEPSSKKVGTPATQDQSSSRPSSRRASTQATSEASQATPDLPKRQSSRKSSLPVIQTQTPQPLPKTPSQGDAMNDSKMSGIQGLFQTPEANGHTNGNEVDEEEVDEDSVYLTPATPKPRRGRPSRASIAASPALETETANLTLPTRTSTRNVSTQNATVSTQNTTIDDPEALNQLFRTPEPNKIVSPAPSKLSSRRSSTQSAPAPAAAKVSMTPKRQSSRVSTLQQITETQEPQKTPTNISKMEKTLNMSGMPALFQTPEMKTATKEMNPASAASSKLNYSRASTVSLKGGRKSRASISSSLNVETDTRDLSMSMFSDKSLPQDETVDESEAFAQLFQTPEASSKSKNATPATQDKGSSRPSRRASTQATPDLTQATPDLPKRQSSRKSVAEAQKMETSMNMSGIPELFQTPEATSAETGDVDASTSASARVTPASGLRSLGRGRKSRVSTTSSMGTSKDNLTVSMVSDGNTSIDTTADKSFAFTAFFQTPSPKKASKGTSLLYQVLRPSSKRVSKQGVRTPGSSTPAPEKRQSTRKSTLENSQPLVKSPTKLEDSVSGVAELFKTPEAKTDVKNKRSITPAGRVNRSSVFKTTLPLKPIVEASPPQERDELSQEVVEKPLRKSSIAKRQSGRKSSIDTKRQSERKSVSVQVFETSASNNMIVESPNDEVTGVSTPATMPVEIAEVPDKNEDAILEKMTPAKTPKSRKRAAEEEAPLQSPVKEAKVEVKAVKGRKTRQAKGKEVAEAETQKSSPEEAPMPKKKTLKRAAKTVVEPTPLMEEKQEEGGRKTRATKAEDVAEKKVSPKKTRGRPKVAAASTATKETKRGRGAKKDVVQDIESEAETIVDEAIPEPAPVAEEMPVIKAQKKTRGKQKSAVAAITSPLKTKTPTPKKKTPKRAGRTVRFQPTPLMEEKKEESGRKTRATKAEEVVEKKDSPKKTRGKQKGAAASTATKRGRQAKIVKDVVQDMEVEEAVPEPAPVAEEVPVIKSPKKTGGRGRRGAVKAVEENPTVEEKAKSPAKRGRSRKRSVEETQPESISATVPEPEPAQSPPKVAKVEKSGRSTRNAKVEVEPAQEKVNEAPVKKTKSTKKAAKKGTEKAVEHEPTPMEVENAAPSGKRTTRKTKVEVDTAQEKEETPVKKTKPTKVSKKVTEKVAEPKPEPEVEKVELSEKKTTRKAKGKLVKIDVEEPVVKNPSPKKTRGKVAKKSSSPKRETRARSTRNK